MGFSALASGGTSYAGCNHLSIQKLFEITTQEELKFQLQKVFIKKIKKSDSGFIMLVISTTTLMVTRPLTKKL
jgi:hypothetical protein